MAAQWYCPPEVGYTLQISAMDAAMAKLPMKDGMIPQMMAHGPPEGKATDMDVAMAVHELRMA